MYKRQEVTALKAGGYNPQSAYYANPQLKRAVDSIATGVFSNGDTDLFRPVVESLLYRDEYLVLADYQAYVDIQDKVDKAYRDQERWTRMSILNTARCGYFSSDRTIQEYCDQIWKIKMCIRDSILAPVMPAIMRPISSQLSEGAK